MNFSYPKQNPLPIDKFSLKNTEIVRCDDVSSFSEYSEASSSLRYVKPSRSTPPTPAMQTSEVPGNNHVSKTIGRGYLKETISKFHSLRIGD